METLIKFPNALYEYQMAKASEHEINREVIFTLFYNQWNFLFQRRAQLVKTLSSYFSSARISRLTFICIRSKNNARKLNLNCAIKHHSSLFFAYKRRRLESHIFIELFTGIWQQCVNITHTYTYKYSMDFLSMYANTYLTFDYTMSVGRRRNDVRNNIYLGEMDL